MEISENAVKFILEHSKDDTNTLRLRYSGKSDIMDFPLEFALLQIDSRRKAQKKIPTFLEHPHFIFPDEISAEQASNEVIARFHTSLLPPNSSILDLTAGLGIDAMTFAMNGMNVTACEINEEKACALKKNAEVVGVADRLRVLNIDSTEYITNLGEGVDVVFCDPARRAKTGKRVHALSDCQPDILSNMNKVLGITDRLLIKSSPLLDLTLVKDSIKILSQIYVVCLKGECKEVLIDIEKGRNFLGVTVVDLDTDKILSLYHSDRYCSHSEYPVEYAERSNPSDYKYLYEPNAGVMKTGAWGELTHRFPGLVKADVNTHLFLSDMLFEDFPGRTLAILSQPDKRSLKALKGTKCNVAARNHPLQAADVQKKHTLIPGGDRFLYALRYKSRPLYLLAKPVVKDLQDQE